MKDEMKSVVGLQGGPKKPPSRIVIKSY